MTNLINFFVRTNTIALAEILLNLASKIKSEGIKIKYHKGYWLHRTEMFDLVDFAPQYTMKNSFLKWVFSEVYYKKYTPKDGDVCVDIGSGIGTETLSLSKLVGNNGKVYSVEAAKATYDLLLENINVNNCNNVKAMQLAISNNSNPIYISSGNDAHIKNRLTKNDGEKTSKVNAVTMDSFIKENSIDCINYLKINIEGAEQLLIQEFREIRNVKNIAISCHDFLGKREGNPWLYTKEKVKRFLLENNFTIYTNETGIDYADDWLYAKRNEVSI